MKKKVEVTKLNYADILVNTVNKSLESKDEMII